jgi:long-chain acyl-CoA synthetase
MLTRVQVGIADSTPLKRALFNFFMPRAIAMERRRLAGEAPSARDELIRRVGEAIIFAPLKDYLGLSRARHAFTGGEALGEDTFLFFRALGIKLTQLYGQTETCAMTAIQFADDVRLDTVGRPLPGVEIKLGHDGEILVRSQSTVDGYFNDAATTAKAFTGDGWLRTGDAGAIEPDGQLIVYGRVSEVVHTAAGDRYIPNYIENRIKFSPYVSNLAVLGAGKPWLAAIVCIDREAVGHWAEQRGLAYSSFAELSQLPEVGRLVGASLAEINRSLPAPLRIRRFVNLHKDFDADDGEITRTRKLRRTVVEERYAPLIAALYAGAEHADVEITITYENGTTGVFARKLALADVDDGSLEVRAGAARLGNAAPRRATEGR